MLQANSNHGCSRAAMHSRPRPGSKLAHRYAYRLRYATAISLDLGRYLSDCHTGLKWVNMAQAISTNKIEEYPIVTADRSSIHATDSSGSNGSAVSTSVNMWDVHGLILSFSVILNCLGILLIRSGLKWAFRGHWIVQALSALGLLIGCLIGVLKSTHVFQVCNSRP